MPYSTPSLDHRLDGRLGDYARPRPQPRPRRDPCADECEKTCPACGGLECLCRPRFFPGQLLTDDDLNLLSRYIVEKNKLHNRYLHGWGVACGLEVTCNGCDPHEVVVGTGYALSPCGDDIVVCRDQSVDVCELIEQCRPAPEPVCDPPYDRPPRDCRRGKNRWVLAICYDERPSRGVTALLGAADNACKSPCSCGGSSSCGSCGGSGCSAGNAQGCGCGGSKPSLRPRKQAAKHCEPTQICEGYRFMVYPEPEVKPAAKPPAGNIRSEEFVAWLFENRKRFGPLLERVFCCMQRAASVREGSQQASGANATAALDVYGAYLEAMRDFAEQFGVHRCSFVGTVGSIYQDGRDWIAQQRTAGVMNAGVATQLAQRLYQLDAAWLDVISECFCSALLPACPEPAASNCVPLAVVTLRGNDCRVVEICNWQQRKLLITWRTVGYWLSWLPWNCLRETFAKMCCGDGRQSKALVFLMLMLGVAKTGLACGTDNKYDKQKAAGMTGASMGVGAYAAAFNAPQAAAFKQAMDADNVFGHLLGEFERMRDGSAEGPLWAKVASQLADGSALHLLAGDGAADATGGVQAQLKQMQAQIDAQQLVIDRLLGV